MCLKVQLEGGDACVNLAYSEHEVVQLRFSHLHQ